MIGQTARRYAELMMTETVLRYLQSRYNMRLVTSDEELEAVYRLRYDVYWEEHQTASSLHDHEAQKLRTDYDTLSNTRHFLAGSVADPVACVTVRDFDAGEIPAHVSQKFRTHLLPGIDGRRTCLTEQLVVRADLRGTALATALVCYSATHTVANRRSSLALACASPGLLRTYRRLGFRSFGAPLIQGSEGLYVPLVLLNSDLAHLYKVRSPSYASLAGLAAVGKGIRDDVSDIQAYIDAAAPQVYYHGAAEIVSENFGARMPSFLANLRPALARRVLRSAVVIRVRAGERVAVQGTVNPLMFMVVQGVFSVDRDGALLSPRGAGELLGEQSFFAEDGRRRVTVTATSDALLVVFSRSFLKRLRKTEPLVALEVYQALVQRMAQPTPRPRIITAPLQAQPAAVGIG